MDRVDEAMALMKGGCYEQALDIFEHEILSGNRDWSVNYMAGQCARFAGDLPKAANFLQRASRQKADEPSVHLALGIVLQLLSKLEASEDCFRSALKLDGNNILAFNSLAITQKKMGKFDIARHNLQEALRLLAKSVAIRLENDRNSPINPEPRASSSTWTDFAIQVATVVCALDSNVGRLAWPTGEMAAEEARNRSHQGLYWIDSRDRDGTMVRLFLPNFFNTIFKIVSIDQMYPNLIVNLGSVLELLGDRQEGDAYIKEAQEFSGR